LANGIGIAVLSLVYSINGAISFQLMTATNEGLPLTNDEKHDDLPLARRPSGAITKVALGSNRILSDMAADALALMPSPHRKTHPLRIVVVSPDDFWLETMREIIPKCFNGAEVVAITRPVRALSILEECAPDLLITADVMPQMRGKELVRILIGKNVNYPILVQIGSAPIHQWVNDYASQGFNIGFLTIEHLKNGSNGLKRRIEEILIRQSITKQSAGTTKIFNGQKSKITVVPETSSNDEDAEFQVSKK
jgi:CheY-like chemotaxis protein